ncbi:NAD(P)H-flavin reductase [Paraneptunicella aestuarii]|uniref:NAD(P)H-flavin reductase n=1 Tax=Paraneptunicella aestuarii TaxID=2831148 RepID=UPI001E52A469|nr:NAD(P)H-flavin reductase [Paraneptunicella aestuarii]UAA39212.1 NAD(P)H-flavin reductase [Paraneptunicella aestuarii]
MADILCRVEKMEALTPAVISVTLVPEAKVDFQPGQYLQVVMAEQDKRPFSIANAPREDNKLELQIGATPDNPYAYEVVERMKSGSITVSIPHGEAYYRDGSGHPVLLIAGGTGYSYARSILHYALHHTAGLAQPLTLYWGTRTLADMYEYKELLELAKVNEHFVFVPVIEEAPDNWHGAQGWVHHAVMDDFANLADYQIYVAGRFEMAGAIREDFKNKGIKTENLFGDAYAFI